MEKAKCSGQNMGFQAKRLFRKLPLTKSVAVFKSTELLFFHLQNNTNIFIGSEPCFFGS